MDRRRTTAWLLGLTLALGVAVLAAGLLSRYNQGQRAQRLSALADRVGAAVTARVRTYEYGLRGARGAVAAVGVDELTRYRFQSYIATRDLPGEFPGAHGFGFIRRVAPDAREAMVARARRDGRPDFEIRQFSPHGGDLYVIEHIEPEASNRQAVGLDIGSEPLRRHAADEAERLGHAVLTAPITLVQQDAQPNGAALMLLPVYSQHERRDHAVAWVYAPLLMAEVMSGFDLESGSFVLAIDDVTDGTAVRNYRSAGFDAQAAAVGARNGLDTQRELSLHGRRWRVTLLTTPVFQQSLREVAPWQLAAAVFVLLSLLLGGAAYYRQSRARLRQAHADHAQLAAIVENSIDAIIGKRGDGVVTSWNRAAEQMFGYSREEAVGRPLAELVIPPDLLDEEVRILGRIARGERVSHFDTVRRSKDGRLLNVSIAVSPIRDERGQIIGASKTVRDITLQKESEQRIRQLNATLEQQVAERTRELFHALEAAQQASQAKAAFLANMSHEIRTPMNAVLGLAYLAERQSQEAPVRTLIAKISESGRNLLRILNDVLDFSKIEQGRLELEVVPFDLQQVLDRLATMMGAAAGHKPLELVIAPLPDGLRQLVGDATRLEQVLANLVGNAIKFTQAGHVHVGVRLVGEHDGQLELRFSVQDSGIGIPADKVDHIFHPFTQVDASTTRRFGGTGLGLAICRQIVGLMGGQMGVHSVEGRGSEFWFTALLARQASGDSTPRDPLRNLRVLFADDSELALEALRRTGEQLGWLCEAVSDGEEALQAATAPHASRQPEVLVLDWQMPRLDGLEVARALRDQAPQPHQPIVIMVTAHSRETLVAHPDVALADGVLTKPVTASALYDAVARAMRDRGLVEAERQGQAVQQQRLLGARVLVVDDSEINRELARHILSGEGAQVLEAGDGQQAVLMLQQAPQAVDLVLMDVQMPVMDGLTATGMIRQIAGCEGLPVVALTAGAFASDREAALAAGVSAVVTKPFNVDHTVNVIRTLIDERQPPEERPPVVTEPADHADLIDVAGGQRIWGDPTIFLRYLDRFLAEYATFPQDARSLPELSLGHALHKFKGAAAAVCLPGLVARAQVIEQRRGQGQPLTDGWQALADTMQATLAARAAMGQQAMSDRTFELLRRLVRALETGGPAQALIDELAQVLPDSELTRLRRALVRGDRGAATEVARGIGRSLRPD